MIAWLATAAWAALLWWSCTRPALGPSDLPEHTDKLVHAASWAVLAGLAALAARARRGPRLAAVVAAAIAFGAAVEWAQGRIPGRDGSIADLAADALGAVLGAAAARYGSRRHGDRP